MFVGSISMPPPGLVQATNGAQAGNTTSTVPQGPPPPPPDPFDSIQRLLSAASTQLTAPPPSASVASPPAASPAPQGQPQPQPQPQPQTQAQAHPQGQAQQTQPAPARFVERLAGALTQAGGSLEEVAGAARRAGEQLAQESTLREGRGELGQALERLAQAMHSAGSALQLLAVQASMLRLGAEPGAATLQPPTVRPRSTLQMSVPVITLRRPSPGQPQQQQQPPQPGAPQGAHEVDLSQALGPLFQIVGSMLRGMQPPPQQHQPPSGAPGVQPPPASQEQQPPAAVAAIATADITPAPVTQPSGQPQPQLQAQQQQPQLQPPPPPPGTGAPGTGGVSHAAAAGGPAAQAAAMMTQMLGLVQSALGAAPGGGGPNIATILAAVANPSVGVDTAQQPRDPLADMFQVAMEELSIPDVLQVMQGNWAPLQRLHAPLQQSLSLQFYRRSVAQPQAADYEAMAAEMLEPLARSIDERHLPAALRTLVLPGREVTDVFLRVLRRHAIRLLELIAAPQLPTAQQPQPFAQALRDWSADMCGELLTELSAQMRGGLDDALQIVRYFLSERLQALGPEFAPLAANLITSYLQSTYAVWRQRHAPQPPPEMPMPALATAASPPPIPPPIRFEGVNTDPASWAALIAQDQDRQTAQPPQPPPSEAYQAGASFRKRKARKLPASQEAPNPEVHPFPHHTDCCAVCAALTRALRDF